MLNDRERNFIDAVCYHVRCKHAHDCIRKELGDHIEDQREAFIAEGMTPADASAAAIREMGETEIVGGSMDKAYRPHFSLKMLALFAAILALGFVFRVMLGLTDLKEIFCFCFGAVLFFIILRFWNIGWMFDKAWWFIEIYAAVMVIIPFFPLIDLEFVLLPVVNGTIPQFLYLQLLQPIIFAMFVWKLKDKGILGAGATLPFVIVTLLPSLTAPHFFIAGTMGLIDLSVLLYAIAKGWFGVKRRRLFAIVSGAAVMLILCVIFFAFDSYYVGRLGGLFSIDSWHTIATKDVLAHCRFFGSAEVSMMRTATAEWLGSPNNLYMMLIVCAEKLGLWVYFAAALLVVGLIAGLIRLCLREKTMLCRTMSLAITGTLFAQFAGYFADNLGMGIGTLPMPFISYGNTSLILNMALMGMLFCILAKGWMYSEGSEKKENQLRMS